MFGLRFVHLASGFSDSSAVGFDSCKMKTVASTPFFLGFSICRTHSLRSLVRLLRIKAFFCWKPSFLGSNDTRDQFRIPDTSIPALVAVILCAGNSWKTGPSFGRLCLLATTAPGLAYITILLCVRFRLRLRNRPLGGGALPTRTPTMTTLVSDCVQQGVVFSITGGFALIISCASISLQLPSAWRDAVSFLLPRRTPGVVTGCARAERT